MRRASPPDSALRSHVGRSPLEILRATLSGVARSIAPDQHVSMEGGRRDNVIGVVAGLLRCFRVTPDGRRHVTRFVRPDGLIGLGSHDVYRNSVEAVTRSTIITFPARILDAGAEQNALIRQATVQAMTTELAARDRIQFRLGRLWADERVADFLLELCDESGDDPASGSICMPRGDIADHLGVTIETVSRALQRFQKLGLLEMAGAHKFKILRRRDLLAFAAGDCDHYPQPSKCAPRNRTVWAA